MCLYFHKTGCKLWNQPRSSVLCTFISNTYKTSKRNDFTPNWQNEGSVSIHFHIPIVLTYFCTKVACMSIKGNRLFFRQYEEINCFKDNQMIMPTNSQPYFMILLKHNFY